MFSSNATQVSSANYIEDVFSTYLYTGNSSTQTITNGIDLSTKGGMVWQAVRSGTNAGGGGPYLFDTARGALDTLASSDTGASYSRSGSLTSFNTTGFAMGSNAFQNGSGNNLVSWTFRKQAKFFDVVTYTGTGSLRTVSHSLGSVPGCIIIKNLSDTDGWLVYHRSIGATKTLSLNTTGAAVTDGNTYFNDTEPTSTQFTVNIGGKGNQSGNNYVAYLFAHDAGGFGLSGSDNVISCGSLTSSGSGGATVTLNYEAQWILLKNTSAAENWIIVDTMRGMSFSSTPFLKPNLSDAEGSLGAGAIVPTATGFTVANGVLSNSNTYIYIAIRRGPMKVPTSGTSVFSPALTTDDSSLISAGFPVDSFIYGKRDIAFLGYTEDRLRGSGQTLRTNTTGTETAQGVTNTFDNNTGVIPNLYGSTTSMIAWMFKRAPSFFDEVCYTGTGTAQNITHNLGVVPELWIVKKRSSGTNRPWRVGTGNGTTYMALNSVDASTSSSDPWNNTAPTASVFTVGIENATNESSATFVAYLFATCAGVSKVGSYTGTGTTKQVDCGFTGGARFVLIKRTDSTGDWYVWDTARGIVSGNDPYLLMNSSDAEVTNTDYVDTYSAGFEISSTAPAAINASGGTFIFLAIA